MGIWDFYEEAGKIARRMTYGFHRGEQKPTKDEDFGILAKV